MPVATPRRTQAQRRAATIERLINACIDVLAESGYAGAGVKAICDRAGLSQGALFRHFDTRIELLVATVDVIGQRNVDTFRQFALSVSPDNIDGQLGRIVALMRALSRSELQAAWREVIAAARTHPDLGVAAEGAVLRLETSIIDVVNQMFDVAEADRLEVGTTVLSLLHMFDSEAVTVAVQQSPEIEAVRLRWAEGILRDLLQRFGPGARR
ncbi:MAG: TetR/AcrR family transcriptional regulator [Myxococcota bacterium]